MSLNAKEQAAMARIMLAHAPVRLEIERRVCGCDYGGTSWTTVDEARQAAGLLRLGPGKRLLDIGAGSGWPGLYLAATTGCDVVLTDISFYGLRAAACGRRRSGPRPTTFPAPAGLRWRTPPRCRSEAAGSTR